MMAEITLVQHSFNPETNNTSFICASAGQGLNGVAPDPAGPRFVGPNAGDFDLWGIVGLFQVDPDGTMTFVPERTGGKFVNPDGFEFRRISLDRTLNYFATGEGRWTVQAAIDHAVPMHVIASSLFARFTSRQDDSPAMKAIAAMRRQFGGHAVQTEPPPGGEANPDV